ncbi:DEAD/DEAH box helicase [Spirosoma utsteinense]|uniref:RNA helicase n=1 Tax=Spirosoma utsteinense TaxID=2585773 RepID=A0ABR6WEF7_9BACT|nr:DEAD/DEAH box helicase [Spirosoma utsteinense]MBC3788102.1 ATP-dependent RNA helicase DeaD [Spirosoma utsteinense]MBC3794873.1 ATP-dependent RNA helicase DeaD [Spirosoma utsteinense]
MKTKKTKGDAQDGVLTLDQIEQVAADMAASAGTSTEAAKQEVAAMELSDDEPKPVKATKKKAAKAAAETTDVAPTEASVTDETVEAIVDEVIVVADEPLPAITPQASVADTAEQSTADTTAKVADPNQILFSDLDISDELLQAVTDMGFTSPSPIQAEAIPPILAGRDVIGQAQTGTGKTAAFGIPALDLIDVQDRSVQVLILCPTRELAVQVSEEIKKLAKYKRGVRTEAIYGGDSIERQIRSLKTGVHIVIGTPGRVMDHMERNTLKLGNVKMMILDEADEMLDMGFREDIENILSEMPEERQTILFSATMSKPILQITQKFQKDPVLVKVVKKELTNTNIEQVYFEVKPKAKVEVMCRLIDMYDLKLLLVFCNTKRKVDEIVEDLQGRGYQAEGLHGDLRQSQRSTVMGKFRSGTTSILVATDVAARGIDVDDVDAVINFDIPLDEEYYVHRIGRTGRAGKSGRAFSMVGRDEKYRFREIQAYTKVRVDKGVIPSFEDIVGVRKARFIEQLQQTITESKDLNLYDDLLTQLHHTGFTTEQIVAALVKRSMGLEKNEFADQNLALEDDRRPATGRDRNERGPSRYEDRRGGGRDERPAYGDRGNSRFGSDRDRPAYGDRGGRTERPAFGDKKPYFERDEKRVPRESDANMTRLMVSIGRKDYVRPGDIVGAIAGEANIPGNTIGSIDIFDKHTYVDVPKDVAKRVVDAMEGNTIKGRRVSIEIAR